MESPESTAKLRLMCSYGGHILPRPATNSFFYAGGETRILSIQRRTLATLSSFRSHPFTLKYQLPHLHLDSVITLASDEDLHILVDEQDRSSSRIRVFLFPAFRHPKSESWLLDALKSSSIMHHSTHLFPPPPSSLPSDSTVSSIISQRHNICYQEPVLHVSEARLSAETVHVETQIPFVSSNEYSSFPRFNPVVQSATRNLPVHTYQQPPPSSHLVYQSNPIFPLYLVPTQPSLNLNVSSIASHVPHNYTSNSHNYLTHIENQERQIDVCPMRHHQSQYQNICIASMESADSGNEVDNNLTRDQIYKSQPPTPPLPSKHQTMRKATPKLLSEALAQLHVHSLNPQQTETSHPQ